MSVRAEHPLAFAFGMFAGAIVTDLVIFGFEAFGHVMHWREYRK